MSSCYSLLCRLSRCSPHPRHPFSKAHAGNLLGLDSHGTGGCPGTSSKASSAPRVSLPVSPGSLTLLAWSLSLKLLLSFPPTSLGIVFLAFLSSGVGEPSRRANSHARYFSRVAEGPGSRGQKQVSHPTQAKLDSQGSD